MSLMSLDKDVKGNAKNVTRSYLHRMIYYIEALAHDDSKADAKSTASKRTGATGAIEVSCNEENGERLVHHLAQTLLLAADPFNLISSLEVPLVFLPGKRDRIDETKNNNNRTQDGCDIEPMGYCSVDENDADFNNDDTREIDLFPNAFTTDNLLKVYSSLKGGQPRPFTRIDALRSLLRALAPIALDVCVCTSCIVLRELREANSKGDNCREGIRALVLFGFWTPIAPQICPILNDLFGQFHLYDKCFEVGCSDGSGVYSGLDGVARGYGGNPLRSLKFVQQQLLNGNEDSIEKGINEKGASEDAEVPGNKLEAEEAVVAAEATHELLDYYSCKRFEADFVQKWWNWDTILFALVFAAGPPSGEEADNANQRGQVFDDVDVVMKDLHEHEGFNKALKDYQLIGGYSPQTNAPHCTSNFIHWKNPMYQIKWHASRALGALFSLRPLPLTQFLKEWGVYENDVPFVRHPWRIWEEESVWQGRLIGGVGKVVLDDYNYGNCGNDGFYGVVEGDRGADEAGEDIGAMDGDDDGHGDGNDDNPKNGYDSKEDSGKHTFPLPTLEQVRQTIAVHRALVHAGQGILLPRRGSVASYDHWCHSSTSSKPIKGNEIDHTDHVGESNAINSDANSSYLFFPTQTTKRNMTLLGIAMSSTPHPPPILICGPSGSGKSSLVRHMARLCSSFRCNSTNSMSSTQDELLELHIDNETDSKTLLGQYVATDIPGEFLWMPGPLTTAARSGRWVLIEDVDGVPEEIFASLILLLEERVLPIDNGSGGGVWGGGSNGGHGRGERVHPNFRLFGTCVTSNNGKTLGGGGGKRILHPNLWRKVPVDPLPFSELKEVGQRLFPKVPESVAGAVLEVFRALDRSGRGNKTGGSGGSGGVDDQGKEGNQGGAGIGKDEDSIMENTESTQPSSNPSTSNSTKSNSILGHGARPPSVREYIKLLSRISSCIKFEPGSQFATESQRLICLAETMDVFCMSCPIVERRREFIMRVGAPIWGLTVDMGLRYMEGRVPSVEISGGGGGGGGGGYVKVGRVRLSVKPKRQMIDESNLDRPGSKQNFAETNHALRFMESIAVCASVNEPALLVGETGCGKTTLVQRLASLTNRTLLVQNLSLQTDSTDLLGGYKPLEMRYIARNVYDTFVDLFGSSFSRSQNGTFLNFVLVTLEKRDWKKLGQCFLKAARMGENKMRELTKKGKDAKNLKAWAEFRSLAEHFERQRVACESGLAFAFTEGALVDAIRSGKWVLLDEINLASSETLQRLCGLLDDCHGSITLTEKGDAEAVKRHPDFRIFGAMNPATDAGKKDLPASIRSRFTEIYVDELVDPIQLRSVSARYLEGVVTTNGASLEHSESIMMAVDVYLNCRSLSDESLVDGGGQRPRYTMRTLCRALIAARNLIVQQRFAPKRALLEGFELAFEGSLDLPSREILQKCFQKSLSNGISSKERDYPCRRPEGRIGQESHLLVKPFWIKTGNEVMNDWADPSAYPDGRPKFVLTASATSNLRRICQAVASGPWSILLEGPTSAGKTTLVEYLAARCGHKCLRINNHEHTDIQEYTGSYAADSNGKISFQEGVLIQSLRKGHWVILDELNLAPCEVLEALNRLLDDNRELYLPEINETVKPHPNFRLFATQNPAGAYGGRKPLSKAFRNRFVEIHVADIPEEEMITILERRCGCPLSHAKLLVKVMKSLRQRRSRTGIFRGKDGLVTPRDLLRWANRGASSKVELAKEGYMLLAERLRIDEEKEIVQSVIEKELKVSLSIDETYYGACSEGRELLSRALKDDVSLAGFKLNSIAQTQSILRLLALVMRCIKQQEPVLLVGDTGCGKTTVVQLLSAILSRQLVVVNCHASTETSDLLGGFRPVRGRQIIAEEMINKAKEIIEIWSDVSFSVNDVMDFAPSFISQKAQHESLESEMVSDRLTMDKPKQIIDFVRKLKMRYLQKVNAEARDSLSKNDKKSDKKRRKLSNGKAQSEAEPADTSAAHRQSVNKACDEIEILFQKYSSLFEWADGPLVKTMKAGCFLLLDEMSLAEDAVLERLNSVLEPSRTVVLAEKGGEGPSCAHESGGCEVIAHENFRIFATMNPGGDFGKRELSPALRSRFTEIWVPPIVQRSDIDLVLERSLSSHAMQSDLADIGEIRKMMLDYVGWFNDTICDDPVMFGNDFKLSLRDVLSWTTFVSDVFLRNKSVQKWSAYVHGASLMHLDGLGLGTSVSSQDAAVVRNKAKKFLIEQIPADGVESVIGFQDEIKGIEHSVHISDGQFGVYPFIISTGPKEIPSNVAFNMTAPTTGLNLRRVLRAMQISKPILLEGSPGVGKTSLISALASASGHNLVRINLSEQTDISDLMGGDIPFSSSDDADDNSCMSFRWCDGGLLKAIKQGDWVLLDELNLASQSVLEGLNACLDHRQRVYIPELGKEFECPSSFRIFACQNPLAQGGGRKGLPKSFLNRFTKVYIEALTKDDLFEIVTAQFPTVPVAIVEIMIEFNEGIQSDIESRLYGQQGSPWEFNLRDVFRWCQLLTRDENEINVERAAKYADILYSQRLRTSQDRALIRKRFHLHFGRVLSMDSSLQLEATSSKVMIGSAVLDRNPETDQWCDVPFQYSEPDISQSLVRPMEAAAFCIKMNWPCLLVGPSSSGKTTILKMLADCCNVHLETLAMSSSTDTTELIGCFEQKDATEGAAEIFHCLHRIYKRTSISQVQNKKLVQTINNLYWDMCNEKSKLSRDRSLTGSKALFSAIDTLLKSFEALSCEATEFSKSFSSQIAMSRQRLLLLKNQLSAGDVQSPFHWVDGILVKAMESGSWLHLENVNYCSSSVLDRLNPLMEFGGELIMTECGIADDLEAKPRVVKPHKNFRLFLSMNPNTHGEVSRAMRNRCIEVCLLPPPTKEKSEIKILDAYAGLWDSGIKGHESEQLMVMKHDQNYKQSIQLHEDTPTFKTLKDCGSLFVDLLKRGMSNLSFSSSYQLLYSKDNGNIQSLPLQPSSTGMINGISSRKELEYNAAVARISRESRLIRSIATSTDEAKVAQMVLKTFVPENSSDEEQQCDKGNELWFQVICRLAEATPWFETNHFASLFDGFHTEFAIQTKLIAFLLRHLHICSAESNNLRDFLNDSIRCLSSSEEETLIDLPQVTNCFKSLQALRFPQLLEESMIKHRFHGIDRNLEPYERNVISVSYGVNMKLIDESAVMCPLTPHLYPLINKSDKFLRAFQLEVIAGHVKLMTKEVKTFGLVLMNRDKLWQCLKRMQYLGDKSNSTISFEFESFLVQYWWFKKSLVQLGQKVPKSTKLFYVMRKLLLLIETIDESIQENTGGTISSSDILWKKGGHPQLPSSLQSVEVLSQMQHLSKLCSLKTEEFFGYSKLIANAAADSIDLKSLVAINHPSLFVQEQFFRELLGAIATTFWATTDETKEELAKECAIGDALRFLKKNFKEKESDFITQYQLATIDTSIETVENSLDLEDIKNLGGSYCNDKQNSTDFIQELLVRFGNIQNAQIGEILCNTEEATIIDILLTICNYSTDGDIIGKLGLYCPKIKSFIENFITYTQWPVSDLRPYQTLLWAIESQKTTNDEIRRILNCVLPRIFCAFHSHQWCNSYNDLESISNNLLGPSLWRKDDDDFPKVNSLSVDTSAKSTITASCAGPTKTRLNVHRTAVFRLLRLPAFGAHRAFFTMENSDVRITQSRKLLHLFSCYEESKDCVLTINAIKWLAGNVFRAFQHMFDGDILDVIKLLEAPPSGTSKLESCLNKFQHKSIQIHVGKVVKPLFEHLQKLHVSEDGSLVWKRNIARAWIYLGILRLHLQIPSSPIDPGRKPAAKFKELDFFIQDIQCRIRSHCLHSGLSHGDFDLDSPVTAHLVSMRNVATKKRARQKKKIIERPPSAPLYIDLFREIHQFCRTIASPDNILALAELIEGSEPEPSFISKEVNWQCSASAFCTRLSAEYSMYEDLTIPCINEIRMIQKGLRELAFNRIECTQSNLVVQLQDSLLEYPIKHKNFSCPSSAKFYNSALNDLLRQFGSNDGGGMMFDSEAIHRSVLLAALLRKQIQLQHSKVLSGTSLDEVNSILSSLASVIGSDSSEAEGKHVPPKANEGADYEEKEFLEYFPNHGAEFQHIIESVEDVDELMDKNDKTVSTAASHITELSGLELSVVVSLHKELFSGATVKVDDNRRLRAFVASYEAASKLAPLTEWTSKSSVESHSLGSHVFAMALRSSVRRGAWSPILPGISLANFHHDPLPKESIKADIPLRNLLIRVSQLLRAFPGHSILVALGQVIERVRQLDVHVVSLGKVMSGLEVILRKAQDWEQHASNHVVLGKPLQDLSSLVASWRKLELKSWSSLLIIREQRRSARAKKHWPRLYRLIHDVKETRQKSSSRRYFCHGFLSSPSWVWREFPSVSERVSVDADTKCIDEIAKLFDTFILTSNIAEFWERLGLIEAFSFELRNECISNGSNKRIALTRMIHSFVNYYSRFSTLLLNAKIKLREHIEKCLKDEVKLAKWDEQTYYSLAESSEKNHRKLMKYLRDYDEVLDTSVMTILEQNFAEGVRPINQTKAEDHEAITTIPSDQSLFPEATMDQNGILPSQKNHPMVKVEIKEVTIDDWSNAELNNSVDKYLSGIARYGRRMDSVIPDGNSSAYHGALIAGDMSKAICSRIKALREVKNSTKQVKQRALVDLFKSLKDQGYSSMKWSVPPNIRDPQQMLQLPAPSIENYPHWDKNIISCLGKGESYFHRCQIEISRLRFEISILGSQYMTQREMSLMQGYSDYILFIICQNRSMLACMMQSVGTMESLLQSYDGIVDSMPSGQRCLSDSASKLESLLLMLTESLRQVLLFFKETNHLVGERKSDEKIHDVIAILTGCVSKLESVYFPSSLPVTHDRVLQLNTVTIKVLIDVKADVLECQNGCNKIFPSTIFDDCLGHLHEALKLCELFKEDQRKMLNSSSNVKVCDVMRLISSLVQDSLVSAQSFWQGPNLSNGDSASGMNKNSSDEAASLCRSHSNMVEEWNEIRLDKLNSTLSELSEALICLHGENVTDAYARSLCVRASTNSFSLVHKVLSASKSRMEDALLFYKFHSKLLYILLRVFRVLVAKGFCSDDVSDGEEGDGEGGAGEMKFEDDADGTGMGAGEGKTDVTDEIENEEQLLGLKGDKDQETTRSPPDQKELDKEEADTGMEMEADFEGETFDMPDQKNADTNDEEGQNEEELDREIGDGDDPNEQVVDEKIWDKDEDEVEDLDKGKEKFEENSKMSGEKIQDEIRTKDQEDEDEPAKGCSKEHNPDKNDEAAKDEPANEDTTSNGEDEQEGEINEDTEDKYEEKPGVDVRDDTNATEEKKDSNQDMDLDLEGGMDLDEEGGDKDPETGSPEKEAGDVDGIDVDANANKEDLDEDTKSEENQEICENMETMGQGGNRADEPVPPEDDENEDKEPNFEPSLCRNEAIREKAHGVAAKDGQDAVNDKNEQDPEGEIDDGGADENQNGADENLGDSSQGQGSSGNGGDWQRGYDGEQQNTVSKHKADEVPNPFRSPGDVDKFWHKKLDIIQENQPDGNTADKAGTDCQLENDQRDSAFEFTRKDEESSAQVLGVAEENHATLLEENSDDEFDSTEKENEKLVTNLDQERPKEKPSHSTRGEKTRSNCEEKEKNQDVPQTAKEEAKDDAVESKEENQEKDAISSENAIDKVITTASTLANDEAQREEGISDENDSVVATELSAEISIDDIQLARAYWQEIQNETNNLSRRLCEKLRLVMEPLVATRLRGDYRTGKRVNMKRIIGYIASGYRKDKIWLRRTKPAKRDYRVLIAVDNSESMQKSRAGDMALRALATLANGMSQLEVGQLGVASFGNDMQLLHPFHTPFTSESGVNIVSNFKFEAKRTRTALCVESSIAALEDASSGFSSMQLVFMISDGRIERDSRCKLRHLIRQMAEKNMLMVMIVVEGEKVGSSINNNNDSILHMKEVSFVKGKPQIKNFIEDYPFPYYLVVGDLAALPEILGDALRQWFEMLAQIQNAV